MIDFAWSELAIIAAVALIVLGPKELPKLLRTVGHWVAKARGLARDFQMQVDDMVRQAELDDLKKQVDNVGNQIEEAGRVDVAKEIESSVDPKGELQQQLKLPDLTHPDATQTAGSPAAGAGASDGSTMPSGVTGLTEPVSEDRAASAPPASPPAAATDSAAGAETQPAKTGTA
ncbi:MAG: twin-arginine translocase subunit TatB [Alphaproteobacteria bacterium]|nr:twin-arginine translocase subunit TatB [Alphaproteobacteria bacterium]